MKKVNIRTQRHDWESGEKAAQALNDLSGVVAAEAHGQNLTAYAGDRLSQQAMTDALDQAGVPGQVVGEEPVTEP